MSSTLPITETRELLSLTGYGEHLVSDYLFTTVSDTGTLRNDRAPLVAFSELPYDMRTACVALVEAPNSEPGPALERISVLSAPFVLTASSESVTLWSVKSHNKFEQIQAEPRSTYPLELRRRFQTMPRELLARAKAGRGQLEFVDAGLFTWAEKLAASTLTDLLEKLVGQAVEAIPSRFSASAAAQRQALRVVFQLFACRVLQDHGLIGDSDDPNRLLTAANEHFSDNLTPEALDTPYVRRSVVADLWRLLSQKFAFASLTTEMLGHAYERALVTPAVRKSQGIYYTPPDVTRYIMNALPIESIAEADRSLLDPCCGSGSFLLAGFHRLADLLPSHWTPSEKHRYLRRRIRGTDTDPFAREIAALSLVLVDLHNKNGWHVTEADARELRASDVGGAPSIVATNPPFKEIKDGSRRELSVEILMRMLKMLRPGGLMGVVLPQSVLETHSARKMREAMVAETDVLEIATLPGGLFESQADTAVLLLRKAVNGQRSQVTNVRELRAADLATFKQRGTFTRTYSADVNDWREDADFRFVISPLSALWRQLDGRLDKLGDVATLSAGLQIHKSDKTSKSPTRRSGDVRYVDALSVLRPYALLTEYDFAKVAWLRYGKQLRRAASEEMFKQRKVLINSNRNPGSPWRLLAAIAPKDLYFSDNFNGVMPKDDVQCEEIAAVLNSPVANAWLDGQLRKRKIELAVLRRLPWPAFEDHTRRKLRELVKRLEKAVVSKWSEVEGGLFYDAIEPTEDTLHLLAAIDELVFDAYGLSLGDRHAIEQVVSAGRRPA